MAASGHACEHCGSFMGSRNALFRHLRNGECSHRTHESNTPAMIKEPPSASTGHNRRPRHRLVVTLGYVGHRFHGFARNALANESARPTVEGALVAAVNKVLGSGCCCSETGPSSSSDDDVVASVTQAVATEKGESALRNVVVLGLDLPPSEVQDMLGNHLPPPPQTLPEMMMMPDQQKDDDGRPQLQEQQQQLQQRHPPPPLARKPTPAVENNAGDNTSSAGTARRGKKSREKSWGKKKEEKMVLTESPCVSQEVFEALQAELPHSITLLGRPKVVMATTTVNTTKHHHCEHQHGRHQHHCHYLNR